MCLGEGAEGTMLGRVGAGVSLGWEEKARTLHRVDCTASQGNCEQPTQGFTPEVSERARLGDRCWHGQVEIN